MYTMRTDTLWNATFIWHQSWLLWWEGMENRLLKKLSRPWSFSCFSQAQFLQGRGLRPSSSEWAYPDRFSERYWTEEATKLEWGDISVPLFTESLLGWSNANKWPRNIVQDFWLQYEPMSSNNPLNYVSGYAEGPLEFEPFLLQLPEHCAIHDMRILVTSCSQRNMLQRSFGLSKSTQRHLAQLSIIRWTTS